MTRSTGRRRWLGRARRAAMRLAVVPLAALVLGVTRDPAAVASAGGVQATLSTPAVAIPRAEPPRPDFFRADWRSLNGSWAFEFDDADRGLTERWFAAPHAFSKAIVVPYAFQSKLSGIGDTAFHDVVWYRRSFAVPLEWRSRRVLLNFGAVDYEALVWVNGNEVGRHRGGHVGFTFDVTDALGPDDNTIVVRVNDPGADRTIPRGKQYWQPKSEGIYYTRTTGLWQPVWIEAAGAERISALRTTPNIDAAQTRIDVEVTAARHVTGAVPRTLTLRATARFDGAVQAVTTSTVAGDHGTAVLTLPDQRLWRPDRPALYDLTLELEADSVVIDRVDSYFGQRKISLHDGKVYLNDAPYMLRFVLDQGYWPESTITPPSDEAIQYDIRMTKGFGLNGVRKHQKAEDPRYLYWADKMGLLVWGEMANAHEFSPGYAARFTSEWQELIARDYNHPSIVGWVPINESWGVPQVLTDRAQQAHVDALYHLIKSLDATRPVVDNDGWEHTNETDLLTLHDYARTGDELAAKYAHLGSASTGIPRNGREALVYGAAYQGAPFLLTEFGGIAFRLGAPGAANEWGYSGVEPSREAFQTRLDGLVKAIRGNPAWAGFCYTQLTDVEQEINGLMTYDRKPKLDAETYRHIFAQ